MIIFPFHLLALYIKNHVGLHKVAQIVLNWTSNNREAAERAEQGKLRKGTKQIKGLFKVAASPTGAPSTCVGARRSRSQNQRKKGN